MDTKPENREVVYPLSCASDVEAILARRYDNGADLWTTPDKRINKGGPFSTLGSALMLSELGLSGTPVMKDAADLIFTLWKQDGRFQTAPKAAIYPCHTAGTARILCRLGYVSDSRLKKTFEHLLKIQHTDGGWRCNTYKFGRGLETDFSNPGTTLEALDAFRFTSLVNTNKSLDRAVIFLLNHWETRLPLGPCHYGIGSLFMKVEYPFFRYNLFFYVYVLSFYKIAQRDKRFLDAFSMLRSKMNNGKIVVENPNKLLADFSFCKKGEPGDLATLRYHEIENNLNM